MRYEIIKLFPNGKKNNEIFAKKLAMQIKNIIFDYGGVILNINANLIGESIARAGVQNVPAVHVKIIEKDLYHRIERGEIEPQEFYLELRKIFGIRISDERIKEAWNAMVLDMPPERIRLLEKVRKNYRIFMLSNTNAIHYEKYREELEKKFGYRHFNEIFEKAYFSHLIRSRKPEAPIFEHLIQDANILPGESIFIDDVFENIEAAEQSGLVGLHLREGIEVTDLFDEQGLLVIG